MNDSTNTLDAITLASLEAQIAAEKADRAAADAEQKSAADMAALQSQIDELKRERDLERATHADEVRDLRIAKVVAQASHTSAISTPGQEEVERNKAIAAAGGLAKFYAFTPADRCAMRGVTNSESVSDKTLAEIFGPKSSAMAANSLMKNSPATYRIYKKIWTERRGR